MVQVKLQKVESSNIEAIGYSDPDKTLVVAFIGGRSYTYTPVSVEVYEGLMAAESIGSYFYNHIRNNPKIKCQQL